MNNRKLQKSQQFIPDPSNDFFIEHQGRKIVFEIGGKGKGRSQFKGVEADQKIILAPGIATSSGRISLEMLGFLS
jgi:hypothetical protein